MNDSICGCAYSLAVAVHCEVVLGMTAEMFLKMFQVFYSSDSYTS